MDIKIIKIILLLILFVILFILTLKLINLNIDINGGARNPPRQPVSTKEGTAPKKSAKDLFGQINELLKNNDDTKFPVNDGTNTVYFNGIKTDDNADLLEINRPGKVQGNNLNGKNTLIFVEYAREELNTMKAIVLENINFINIKIEAVEGTKHAHKYKIYCTPNIQNTNINTSILRYNAISIENMHSPMIKYNDTIYSLHVTVIYCGINNGKIEYSSNDSNVFVLDEHKFYPTIENNDNDYDHDKTQIACIHSSINGYFLNDVRDPNGRQSVIKDTDKAIIGLIEKCITFDDVFYALTNKHQVINTTIIKTYVMSCAVKDYILTKNIGVDIDANTIAAQAIEWLNNKYCNSITCPDNTIKFIFANVINFSETKDIIHLYNLITRMNLRIATVSINIIVGFLKELFDRLINEFTTINWIDIDMYYYYKLAYIYKYIKYITYEYKIKLDNAKNNFNTNKQNIGEYVNIIQHFNRNNIINLKDFKIDNIKLNDMISELKPGINYVDRISVDDLNIIRNILTTLYNSSTQQILTMIYKLIKEKIIKAFRDQITADITRKIYTLSDLDLLNLLNTYNDVQKRILRIINNNDREIEGPDLSMMPIIETENVSLILNEVLNGNEKQMLLTLLNKNQITNILKIIDEFIILKQMSDAIGQYDYEYYIVFDVHCELIKIYKYNKGTKDFETT